MDTSKLVVGQKVTLSVLSRQQERVLGARDEEGVVIEVTPEVISVQLRKWTLRFDHEGRDLDPDRYPPCDGPTDDEPEPQSEYGPWFIKELRSYRG